jgi:hypothetical protein
MSRWYLRMKCLNLSCFELSFFLYCNTLSRTCPYVQSPLHHRICSPLNMRQKISCLLSSLFFIVLVLDRNVPDRRFGKPNAGSTTNVKATLDCNPARYVGLASKNRR